MRAPGAHLLVAAAGRVTMGWVETGPFGHCTMATTIASNVREVPELRDRTGVFTDRRHAGNVLAELLGADSHENAVVLAVPAGGVPVAVRLAERLDLSLDVAVVSKITLPWNTESGCGAVAFDGSVQLNDAAVARAALTRSQIERSIERTRDKVDRRRQRFGADAPPVPRNGREAILVDDGLASGFTMAVAVEAVRCQGPARISVAVPTGHVEAVARLAGGVHRVYCANIRQRQRFAVADAYRRWRDVDEAEALDLVHRYRAGDGFLPLDA